MEIEVGEYVRIENDIRLLALGVGKVERIDNRGETIYIKRDNLPISINITKITKHSKKLIDLIEVRRYSKRIQNISNCR